MFNPFDHLSEMPYANVDAGVLFGLAPKSTMLLPDSQSIATALQGHPETVTYWMPSGTGYHQITEDQDFVNNLWLHFAYGAGVSDFNTPGMQALGLAHEYHITPDAMRAAVMGLPAVLNAIVSSGVTEAQVWDYAHWVAPEIVGIA
jgi:hypothetical protein